MTLRAALPTSSVSSVVLPLASVVTTVTVPLVLPPAITTDAWSVVLSSEEVAFLLTVTLPLRLPLLTVITILVLSAKMALPLVVVVPVVFVEVKLPPSIVAVTIPESLLSLAIGLATPSALRPDILVVPLILTSIFCIVSC